MSAGPILEKAVWSDADFAQMGWHDCAVHALALEPALPYAGRLLVDLDYIVEWVHPTPPETYFSFWICPATLVFDQASDVVCDIDLTGFSFELALDTLERSGPDEHGAFIWTLVGPYGFSLSVQSIGFTQYLRRAPIHSPGQRLSLDQRGGLSFAQEGYSR